MQEILPDGRRRVPIKAWVEGVEFEAEARAQVENVASMPFVFHHVAVMPDVHWGMGATVGSVIATTKAIIPAAVGVDIGCGMTAVRTTLRATNLPDDLAAMRSAIEAAVPHGRTDNGGRNDRGAWGTVPESVASEAGIEKLAAGLERVRERMGDRGQRWTDAAVFRQFGTLGTGNHFIEVCLDETDAVWVMLHSGSRGVGNAIGTHYISVAQKECERWMVELPDKDLAYLPESTSHFNDYVAAVHWAQSFAKRNRAMMRALVLAAIERVMGRTVETANDHVDGDSDEVIDCHHNYVERELHFGRNVLVTRKGAVRARAGDLGIIPGSMGARSYVVRGKGNRDSFASCSHGAGRRMSRGEAKRRFTLEDHALATAGVECRKDAEVIDETPGAYKDVDAVLAAESDLVDVVHILRAVLCVKG